MRVQKGDETMKHLLSSGVPCSIHNCVKCCIDTNMPLTDLDVERLSKHGYRFIDFIVKRGGERHLKNVNGRCVFLGDDGCLIYAYRPEGCRLYPLVYNEEWGDVFIHDLCPYGHEFKVIKDDAEKLIVLYRTIYKKK